jgi:hypothetical protein
MEIKNLNVKMLNAYKSAGGSSIKGGKSSASEAGKKSDNFDKIEFDLGRSITAAKVDVTAEVAASAANSRIETLQKAYDGDSLPITPEQIAESIIG